MQTTTEHVVTPGCVLWFTGLSGAGKSTLAEAVSSELRARGCKVEVLDGDVVRTNLSKGLGFSKEDRDTNVRRIGFVAHLLSRNGVIAIASAISPYRAVREDVRQMVGDKFIEIFVDCPLDECIRRDVKGLYQKALNGEIAHFTGISDPYEAPDSSEITVRSDEEELSSSKEKVLSYLEAVGLIPVVSLNGHEVESPAVSEVR